MAYAIIDISTGETTEESIPVKNGETALPSDSLDQINKVPRVTPVEPSSSDLPTQQDEIAIIRQIIGSVKRLGH